MPLWPFFCISLISGAVALVSLSLDGLAPLLIPAVSGYVIAAALDVSKTIHAGAAIISKAESALLFRVSYRMWGPAMAATIQISAEMLIILIVLPALLGYGPFHAGSVSAVCMMAAATHLWGFIHNCRVCGAPEHTKF